MAGWGLSDFTSAISTIQDTVKSLEKQVDNALGVDEATLRQEAEKSRRKGDQKLDSGAQPAEAHEASKATPPSQDGAHVRQATRKATAAGDDDEGGAAKSTKKTLMRSLSGRSKPKSTPTSTPPRSTVNGHAKGGESDDNDLFAAVGLSPSEAGDAPKSKLKLKSKLKTTKKASGNGGDAKKAVASPKKAAAPKKVALTKASDKSEELAKKTEEAGGKTLGSSTDKPPGVEKSRIADATENSGSVAKAVEELSAHQSEAEVVRQDGPAALKKDEEKSSDVKGGVVAMEVEESDKKSVGKTATTKTEPKVPVRKIGQQSEGEDPEKGAVKKKAQENGQEEPRSKAKEMHSASHPLSAEKVAASNVESTAPSASTGTPPSEEGPASRTEEQAAGQSEELETLRHAYAKMQSELESLRDANQKAASLEEEVEAVKGEYGERLAAAERKAYALSKERDRLKKDLEKKGNTSELLKEKEIFIKQVLAEGEQLSKKQATQESTIKKLKSQLKELDGEKEKMNQRISAETARGDALAAEKAKAQADLKALGEEMEKQIQQVKATAAKDLEAERALRSDTENKLADSIRKELEIKAEEAGKKAEVLESQCKQLQETQAMASEAANHREEMLMAEIKDLRSRCEMAESRHAEVVARVPEQTRPLLRQIEALQDGASEASAAYAASEQALSARLEQATAQLAGAEERARMAAERMSSSQAKVAEMEEQVHALRVELSQTQTREKDAKSKANKFREEIDVLQGIRSELEEKLAQLEMKSTTQIANLREELTLTESALKLAQEEREKISQTLKETEETLRRQQEQIKNAKQEELDDGDRLLAALSTTKQSNLDSEALAKLEELEKSLHQKEAILETYKSTILSLEKTRDSLAEELVTATQSLEVERKEAEEGRLLKSEFQALQRRHASALELMGERDEQVDELKADLLDVKGVLRDQTDLMCQQLEAAYKEIAALKEQHTNGS